MKNKLIYPLVVVMVAACGGDGDQTARQSQGEYETVQEGSASGVTSTIHGPGETLPPITGTNADTTTNFALNPDALPPTTPQAQPLPGSTFPPPQGLPPPMTSASPSPVPRPSMPVAQPQPPRPASPPPPEPTEPETPP